MIGVGEPANCKIKITILFENVDLRRRPDLLVSSFWLTPQKQGWGRSPFPGSPPQAGSLLKNLPASGSGLGPTALPSVSSIRRRWWETWSGCLVMMRWFTLDPQEMLLCVVRQSFVRAVCLLCKHCSFNYDILGSKLLMYINVEVPENGREQKCFRGLDIFIWKYAIFGNCTVYRVFIFSLATIGSCTIGSFCQP